jgi:hypothetical protein
VDEVDAVDRLELEEVEREDRALERAGLVGAGGGAAAELAPHVLAPGPGHGAEVDDELARPQQVQLLVDLLQLVGGARPEALALRLLDVRDRSGGRAATPCSASCPCALSPSSSPSSHR